jgi:hypothetical protein
MEGVPSIAGGDAKSKIEKAAIDKKRKAEKKDVEDSKKKQRLAKPAAAKKKSTSPKAAPAKKRSASSTGLVKKKNPEVWSGPPDDKLEGGWPAGWVKKKFERKTGRLAGRADSYWFSPIRQKQLRSMAEVKRFMAALKQANGDEDKAWAIFKGRN